MKNVISVIGLILVLLGIGGFVDCLVIAGTIHLSAGECSGLGACDKVLLSRFASLGGISLWKFGALFYVLYTANTVLAVLHKSRFFLYLSQGLLSFGVVFSLYLIYLQAFVIHAWCPLCLISAAIQGVSFALCLTLVMTKSYPKGENSKKSHLVPALAVVSITALILAATFKLSDSLWVKVDALAAQDNEPVQILTRIDGEEILLTDIDEYVTMKHEFDQFVWNKSKQWHRSKVLSHQAKKKGFKSSTLYVRDAYIKSGGVMDFDAEEVKRLFSIKKQEIIDSGKPVPSKEAIIQMLKIEHQKKYDDYSNQLTDEAAKELASEHLLVPSIIELPIDPAKVPTLGEADAPIQIVIISDFHCIHCRKMHKAIQEIRDELGHNNIQVAYVNHYWEFLPDGISREKGSIATRSAFAAWKQNKFWEYAEAIFSDQDVTDLYNVVEMIKIAEKVGLDIEKFKSDLDSSEAYAFIESHRPLQKLAYAEKPPTILVNGFFVKSSKSKILAKIAQLDLISAK